MTRMTLNFVMLGAAPRLNDGVQDRSTDGLPLWRVRVQIVQAQMRDERRDSSVITVTVPAAVDPAKAFPPPTAVQFRNLAFRVWVSPAGQSGYSLRADGLDAARSQS